MPHDSEIVVLNNASDTTKPSCSKSWFHASSIRMNNAGNRKKVDISTRSESSITSKIGELPLLQSRKLEGDCSKKGLPWKTKPRPVEKESAKTTESTRSKNNDTSSITESRATQPHQIMRALKTKKESVEKQKGGKIHVVACKKKQYGHLVSEQKVMPRDEMSRPIVYSRNENVNKP
mmetsp:Transcript_26143/g.53920  ORF Transcript_26143/g.53920 Transcript_26143/m.53920 type:complete len:177 (+) Transcript_26143:124-654(+)